MALVGINWNPSQKILRQFGYIGFAGFIVIGLFLHYKHSLSWSWCLIPFGLAAIILLSGFFCVKLTKIFYLALVVITCPIGFIISAVLLSFFYYIIITPLGFIFRLAGRDLLRLKRDSNRSSYWVARDGRKEKQSYFRQF